MSDIKETLVIRSNNIERFAEDLKNNLVVKDKLERELKFTKKNLDATNKAIDVLHKGLVRDFKK